MSSLENFNKSQVPDGVKKTVNDACSNLDPSSPLYKCLLKTDCSPQNQSACTNHIDKCFQDYANTTGNTVIASSNDVGSSNGVCPPTKMKHDGTEYIIDTHPNIANWGVVNPICSTDNTTKYIPDHKASKFGIKNRCPNSVSKSDFDKLKKKYEQCQKAFNDGKCESSFNSNEPVPLNQIIGGQNIEETFQNIGENNMLSSDMTVGTKPYGNYSITNHKQFKEIIKGYTPNNELAEKCSAYISDNLSKYPIEGHPDIHKYVLKSSIPAPKRCKPLKEYPIVAHPDIVDYVHKETIPKPQDIADLDISQHPDINNYVLKSTLPTPKRCKTVGEYKIEDHPDFVKYKTSMENKYGSKDQCGKTVACKTLAEYDIKKHPDFKKYGSTDKCGRVGPCKNVGSSDEFQKLNKKYEYTMELLKDRQGDYKKLLDEHNELKDGCAKHFIDPQTGKPRVYESMTDFAEYFNVHSNDTVENFSNVKDNTLNIAKNIFEKTKPSSTENLSAKRGNPWDIKNHKDYHNYILKSECENKYASKDKCGKAVPCQNKCKNLKDYDIAEHPDYERLLLRFGALKSSCGKLMPAPKCPCIVKDKCGKYKYKPCPPQKKCPVCKEMKKEDCEVKNVQTELIKSKMKLDLMITKYKELMTKYKGARTDIVKMQTSKIKNEIKHKENLEKNRNDILVSMEMKQNKNLRNMKTEYDEEVLRLKKELQARDKRIEYIEKTLENGDVSVSIRNKLIKERDSLMEKMAEGQKMVRNINMSEPKYSQHLNDLSDDKKNNSFLASGEQHLGSKGDVAGWRYHQPTTSQMSSDEHKYYHPTKVNYRML